MKLPFFKTQKDTTEYFLALLLREETVSIVALGETAKKLHVAAQHTIHLKTPIEEVDRESLLENIDKAIATVEEQLPTNVELHKTIFGVKENWVEEAKIKKDYLAMLKKISEELELKPIGFLVFSEAIAHLLQNEEGAPVSAILVEIGRQNTTISLLRAGKITETYTEQNERTITHTVESLLAHIISVDILPSRILLFDTADSGKTAQHLLSHTWSNNLPFLHVPQVTILPPYFDIKAVLFGTAAQLNFTADTEKSVFESDQPTVTMDGKAAEQPLEEKELEQKATEKPETEKTIATDNLAPADFGFLLNQDVANINPEAIQEQKIDSSEKMQAILSDIPEKVKEQTTGEKSHQESLPGDSMLLFAGIKNLFKRKPPTSSVARAGAQTGKKLLSFPKIPGGKIVFILPIVAILFVAGIIFYIFKEKAVVTITVSPKTDTRSESIIFAANQGNDFANNTIAGTSTPLTEDGTLQANATGTKQVGDKAKGTVTIYNSNASPRTVPAGTTLTTDTGLKFTFDKDTDVPSATSSGDIFSGIVTKPGNADGTVTASDIGPEYNLPSGTKFTIGTTGTVVAKNASAFSGGTKKQVTVISKDDESKLLDQLTKNLQDKAKNDMNNNAAGDKILLPLFVNTTVKNKNFDKQIGDQASTVTLTESIEFQGISYAKPDIQSFAENIEKTNMSQNMQIAPNGVTIDISDTKQKSDTQITATASIKAQLLPKLDTNQLALAVKSKSFQYAENFIGTQPQVSHVDIELKPNIFFLPKALPRNEKNITIIINNQ